MHLADGAETNWDRLAEIEAALGLPSEGRVKIVDFYHGCDHLKNGCDAIWGESTPRSRAEFLRLKTFLKGRRRRGPTVLFALSNIMPVEPRATVGNALEAELTYFRNQRPRMNYPEYLRQNLPIASGVVEAACKTLVTQRLKRSGMAWTVAGGQALLTFRSLIQSQRWSSAWTLLAADFRQTYHLVKPATATPFQNSLAARVVVHPVTSTKQIVYHALPLAA